MGVTSQDPLCAGSADQGVLQAVFLSHPFFLINSTFGSSPSLLNLEDGSITFQRPYCSDPGCTLTSCQGASILGRPMVNFSMAARVSSSTSWTGRRDVASLGSFFITGLSDIQGSTPQAPMRRLATELPRRPLSDAELAGLELGFRFSGIDGSASSYAVMAADLFVASASLPPFNSSGGTNGTLCPNAVVTSRQTTAQDTVAAAPQVCTAFKVEPVAAGTYKVSMRLQAGMTGTSPRNVGANVSRVCAVLQVCLSTTSSAPGCALSSQQGSLVGVFLDTSVFGAAAQDLLLSSGTMALKTGFCAAANSSSPVEACRGVSIEGVRRNAFTAGFEVASSGTQPPSWSGTRNHELGCFLVQGATSFAIPSGGWLVGAVYNSTTADSAVVSRMAQSVCRPVKRIAPAICLSEEARKLWTLHLHSNPDPMVKQLRPFIVNTNITLERTDNTTLKVRARSCQYLATLTTGSHAPPSQPIGRLTVVPALASGRCVWRCPT